MRADDFAESVGCSYKALIRACVRNGIALGSGVATSLNGGQQNTLTTDLLAKEKVGRPKTKRHN